jgi:hypothetical protein
MGWVLIVVFIFLCSVGRFMYITKPPAEKAEGGTEAKGDVEDGADSGTEPTCKAINEELADEIKEEQTENMLEGIASNDENPMEKLDSTVEDTGALGRSNLVNRIRAGSILHKLRIMVVYVQIVSYLDVTFDVPWPNAVRNFFAWFTFLNIDLEAIFHGINTCFMEVSFLTAFYTHMMIPPCFVLVQIVAMAIVYMRRSANASKSRKSELWRTLVDYLIKDVFLFCFFTYPGLTVRVFRVFQCRTFAPRPELYLVADMSVKCFASVEHDNAVAWAILFIFLYVFGIPAVMYWRLWKYRHVIEAINEDKDRKLQAVVKHYKEQSVDSYRRIIVLQKYAHALEIRKLVKQQREMGAEVQHHHVLKFKREGSMGLIHTNEHTQKDEGRKGCLSHLYTFEKRETRVFDAESKQHVYVYSDEIKASVSIQMEDLFASYEDHLWWWEIFEMARKCLLTGGLVWLREGTSAQILSGFLVGFFHLLNVTRSTPYLDQSDDWLQTFSSLQLVLTLLCGLILKTDNSDHRIYEDAFMEWAIILITVSVFVIGLALIFCEDVVWLGAKRYAEYCKHRLKTWLNNGKEKVSVYSVTFTCPSNGFGFKVIDKPGKPGTAPFLSEITPGKAAARAGKIRNGHEIVSIGCDGKPQKDTSNFSLQDMRTALKRAEAECGRCKIEFKDPHGEITGDTTVGRGGIAALRHVAAYYGRFQARRGKVQSMGDIFRKREARDSYSLKIKKAAENAVITKLSVDNDARKRHQRIQERVSEIKQKKKTKEGDGEEVVEADAESETVPTAGGKYVVQAATPS